MDEKICFFLKNDFKATRTVILTKNDKLLQKNIIASKNTISVLFRGIFIQKKNYNFKKITLRRFL